MSVSSVTFLSRAAPHSLRGCRHSSTPFSSSSPSTLPPTTSLRSHASVPRFNASASSSLSSSLTTSRSSTIPSSTPLSSSPPSVSSSPVRPLSFVRHLWTAAVLVLTVTGGVTLCLFLLFLVVALTGQLTANPTLPSSSSLLSTAAAYSPSSSAPSSADLRVFPFSYQLDFSHSSVICNGSIVTSSLMVQHPVSGRLGWPILSLTGRRTATQKATSGDSGLSSHPHRHYSDHSGVVGQMHIQDMEDRGGGLVSFNNVLMSQPTVVALQGSRGGLAGEGGAVSSPSLFKAGELMPSTMWPSSRPLLFPTAPHFDAEGLTVEFQPALHLHHGRRVIRQAELRWWQSELREDSGEEEGEEEESRLLKSRLNVQGVQPSDVDAAISMQLSARHRLQRLRAV